MSAASAARIYVALSETGGPFWVDGGWGVDALLGRETRAHCDIDLVVTEPALAILLSGLAGLGFAPMRTADQRAWNFVMADPDGHQVDLHVVNFDTDGNGIYGPPENADVYPASAFGAKGEIAGVAVRCTTPCWQISTRTGYTLRSSDLHDIRLLKSAFDL
jgi:lincosamide nucleotidyltransferase A/C/D/E